LQAPNGTTLKVHSLTDEAFAALMAAHLNRESRLGAGNTIQSYGYDQLADFFGKNFGYEASTGIANIRPSVALEIEQGIIPGVSGTFNYDCGLVLTRF